MSASFEISSSTGSYGVTIAQGSFDALLADSGSSHLIADAFFRPRLAHASANTIFLEAVETEKSLDRAPALVERLRAAGVNRRTPLLSVGGGILQDISAFVASIYMRGLTWSYVPTTVLAMVDSCIGGKSSINVGPYKNLVGTFHPPSRIFLDPTLAETLPRDQFASGLIEAAKICFCRGPESFERYLECDPSVTMSSDSLERLITSSLLAKKHFIEIDEFDQNERLLLNFGHTFGHAIEGASHFAIPHGIAVGIGILCSLAFQVQRGVSFRDAPGVEELEAHLHTMIHALPGLSTHLRALLSPEALANVLERLGSDKKHTSTQFTLILIDPSGQVVLERIPRSPETVEALRRAIQSTLETHAQ